MADLLDYLFRSRTTILEMLEMRGYNVDAYRSFSLQEIRLAAENDTLNMFIANDRGGHAIVHYHIMGKFSKNVMEYEVKQNLNEHSSTRISSGDEIIFIVAEPISETLEKATKSRIDGVYVQVFHLPTIVINYTKHELVPYHRRVPETEHEALLKKLHIASKSSMATIKYNEDAIAKFIGLKPGDIVEIHRKSETAGLYLYYRHCAL